MLDRATKNTIIGILIAAWLLGNFQLIVIGIAPQFWLAGLICGLLSAFFIGFSFVSLRKATAISPAVRTCLAASLFLLLGYATINLSGSIFGFSLSSRDSGYQIATILKTLACTSGILLMVVGFYTALFESSMSREELNEERDLLESTLEKSRQFQNRIEDNEKRLLMIFGVALDGVIDIDQDGNIIYWNDQAEKIFGWSRIEALRKPLSELIIPTSQRESYKQGMQNFMNTGEGPLLNRRIEVTARRKNGEDFPVEIGITPIRVGEEWQFTAFVRDISERKDDETRRESLLKDLESARAEAEQSNQVKSEFLAHVSHDIRTPITAIIGYADLLTEVEGRSSEDVHFAERILRSAGHLRQLLDDLIDLARVDAGKVPLSESSCDLQALISDVFDIYEVQAREKLLDFSMTVHPNVPKEILTDGTRLRQIISNLVSNAVKFTQEGSITITADLELSYDFGEVTQDALKIEVVDTGIGIERELTEEIFESFVRVRDVASSVSGTGLGLAIVQRMTALLNGTTSVESELEKGSRFTVRIPCIEPSHSTTDADSQESVSDLRELSAAASNQLFAQTRILLVDDNPENRILFEHMLANMGTKIDVATDGAEGVDKVMTELDVDPFDLILMDVQMPVMDGKAATRHLRENGIDIPIIALTAHASKKEKEACFNAGCSDFISKPVVREELREVLLHHLYKSSNPKLRNLSDSSPRFLQTDFQHDPEFKVLRANYVNSLRVHRKNLRRALETKDTAKIREIAHKICGTATSYGFVSLTESAGRCEIALVEAPDELPKEHVLGVFVDTLGDVIENQQQVDPKSTETD